MTKNDCRAAFETWATNSGKWPNAVDKMQCGNYRLMQVQNDWEAWQAAWDALQAALKAGG